MKRFCILNVMIVNIVSMLLGSHVLAAAFKSTPSSHLNHTGGHTMEDTSLLRKKPETSDSKPSVRVLSKLGFAVALVFSLHASSVKATVDALIHYQFPYAAIQTEGYCLLKTVMWAELGIPSASAMEAIFSDVLIYRQSSSRPGRQVNINALTDIKAKFVRDEYHDEYRYAMFELDFQVVAGKNGNSIEGRQKTVNLAKLSTLALADTTAEQGSNAYKIDIVLKNLPSQAGLKGEKVHATTQFPYSEGSPLLSTYRKELVNLQGECR